MNDFYLIRILFLATLAFVFTIAWTPLWTHVLYKYRLGKKIRNSGTTPIFSQMHAHKAGTPTMGGVLIWVTTLLLAVFFFLLARIFPNQYTEGLDFLSRRETWLPLGALVITALVGLVDDYLDISGRGVFGGGGLKVRHRLLIYSIIAAFGAWWFYAKLDWDAFHIPFYGHINLGWTYMLVFIMVIVSTANAVNLTDGLDGLAGGTLMFGFASYGVISFLLGRYELATFCAVIIGSLLAFLWFNITPARFYMGDTGAMSLGVTLGVLAMLTNTALILPIIGIVFVMETLSVIIQLASKKFRGGKKVFLSTPIHHHFEAKGWSEGKIVMRFWVISGIGASLGLMLFLLDKTL